MQGKQTTLLGFFSKAGAGNSSPASASSARTKTTPKASQTPTASSTLKKTTTKATSSGLRDKGATTHPTSSPLIGKSRKGRPAPKSSDAQDDLDAKDLISSKSIRTEDSTPSRKSSSPLSEPDQTESRPDGPSIPANKVAPIKADSTPSLPLPASAIEDDEDADEDMPIRPSSGRGSKRASKRKVVYAETDEDADDVGSDVGDSKAPRPGRQSLSNRKKVKVQDDDDDDFDASRDQSSGGDEAMDEFEDSGFVDEDDDDDIKMATDSDDSMSTSKKKKPKASKSSKTSSHSKWAYSANQHTSNTKSTASRPPPRPLTGNGNGASGGGGHSGSGLMTQAERLRLEAKEKKKASEDCFEFLVDLRDKEKHRPGDPDYDPRTVYIPPKAWNDFTPFETQFWEIKQDHFDTVLFFQKGKFYELYENDAEIGHAEFDLKLTDRVKMKMVSLRCLTHVCLALMSVHGHRSEFPKPALTGGPPSSWPLDTRLEKLNRPRLRLVWRCEPRQPARGPKSRPRVMVSSVEN